MENLIDFLNEEEKNEERKNKELIEILNNLFLERNSEIILQDEYLEITQELKKPESIIYNALKKNFLNEKEIKKIEEESNQIEKELEFLIQEYNILFSKKIKPLKESIEKITSLFGIKKYFFENQELNNKGKALLRGAFKEEISNNYLNYNKYYLKTRQAGEREKEIIKNLIIKEVDILYEDTELNVNIIDNLINDIIYDIKNGNLIKKMNEGKHSIKQYFSIEKIFKDDNEKRVILLNNKPRRFIYEEANDIKILEEDYFVYKEYKKKEEKTESLKKGLEEIYESFELNNKSIKISEHKKNAIKSLIMQQKISESFKKELVMKPKVFLINEEDNYAIQEYVKEPTLEEFIKREKEKFNLLEIIEYMLSALEFYEVFNKKFIHADFKPENAFIDRREKKIIPTDFEYSLDVNRLILDETYQKEKSTIPLTLQYAPPEQIEFKDVINKINSIKNNYDKMADRNKRNKIIIEELSKIDLYAVASTFAQIITGENPVNFQKGENLIIGLYNTYQKAKENYDYLKELKKEYSENIDRKNELKKEYNKTKDKEKIRTITKEYKRTKENLERIIKEKEEIKKELMPNIRIPEYIFNSVIENTIKELPIEEEEKGILLTSYYANKNFSKDKKIKILYDALIEIKNDYEKNKEARIITNIASKEKNKEELLNKFKESYNNFIKPVKEFFGLLKKSTMPIPELRINLYEAKETLESIKQRHSRNLEKISFDNINYEPFNLIGSSTYKRLFEESKPYLITITNSKNYNEE